MALVQVSEPSSLVWEREIWGGLTKNQSLNTEALTRMKGVVSIGRFVQESLSLKSRKRVHRSIESRRDQRQKKKRTR